MKKITNLFLVFFFILPFITNLNALKIDSIKNSCFCYDDTEDNATSDYYRYIVFLVKTVLTENESLYVNIIIGNNHYIFNNGKKTIKLNLNYEHTLVKEGGRSVPKKCPFGKIPSNNTGGRYHVRIDRYDELNKADFVIDYSLPNIYNIQTSDEYTDLSKKLLYIAPNIYNSFFFDKQNRSNEILTTFINTNEPRRKKLLEKMLSLGLNNRNVSNCFNKDGLKNIYCKTKILINIHQTDHHHTLEELRVLPALSCGVLVICEESPLCDLIPYKDYIIWSSYDQMAEKAIEVSNNYEYYHNKIFGGCNDVFTILHIANIENLKNKIFELSCVID